MRKKCRSGVKKFQKIEPRAEKSFQVLKLIHIRWGWTAFDLPTTAQMNSMTARRIHKPKDVIISQADYRLSQKFADLLNLQTQDLWEQILEARLAGFQIPHEISQRSRGRV